MEQRIAIENEYQRKLFIDEKEEKKNGPSRLNMETANRKTVMKILQDNKQKLKQTRQEMMDEIQQSKNLSTQFSNEHLNTSSMNGTTGQMQPQYNTKKSNNAAGSKKKQNKARALTQNRATDDIVLQSKVYERLAAGMTAVAGRDDMLS